MAQLQADLRRVTFSPDECEALTAFCVAHGSPFDGRLIARLLGELTSDPAGVVVLADDAGTAVVATVVDRASNAADAANLEVLGARTRLNADALVGQVVAPAVAFAQAGTRRALHLALPAALVEVEAAERALRAVGWTQAYDTFHMRREAGALAPPALEPLAEGWRWATLDDGRVEAAHGAITEAFKGQASLGVPPLEDFRRAIAAGNRVTRLLLHEEAIAGFVQVTPRGPRGELAVLGRVPQYAGRGLGARLVSEGLRVLAERGAGEVDLSVETLNDQALALYRRFAFTVVERTPVLALALR